MSEVRKKREPKEVFVKRMGVTKTNARQNSTLSLRKRNRVGKVIVITSDDDDEAGAVRNQKSVTRDSAQQSNSPMGRNVGRGPKRAKDSKKALTIATEKVNLRKHDVSMFDDTIPETFPFQ